jgi:cation-transporting ATPase E
MGSGSPASRAVAKVVLLDDSFATLPRVLAAGRQVLGNIERVAHLFLIKTAYSVVLACWSAWRTCRFRSCRAMSPSSGR